MKHRFRELRGEFFFLPAITTGHSNLFVPTGHPIGV
jgi:hypothetical protein